MERMLDLITKRECDFLTYLDQYHGQRIVVCGAAAGGERICALLKKKGIKNFTVAVEKRYFHEGQVVYGRKVESFESVMKGIDDKCDIIIAFRLYGRGRQKAKREELLAPYMDKIDKIWDGDYYSGVITEEGKSAVVSFAYYENYERELQRVYESLADDRSREVMVSYVRQRITGDYKYSDGMLSPVQYFEEGIISLGTNEVMVDCGGFPLSGEGDAGYFLDHTGEGSYVYLLEPDEGNMEISKERLKKRKSQIYFVSAAAWNEETELSFNAGRGGNSDITDELGGANSAGDYHR